MKKLLYVLAMVLLSMGYSSCTPQALESSESLEASGVNETPDAREEVEEEDEN
jgi:hypothetical protein